jgi:hypothetical protein
MQTIIVSEIFRVMDFKPIHHITKDWMKASEIHVYMLAKYG